MSTGMRESSKWCYVCGMPCGYFSPISGSQRGFCAHPILRFYGESATVPVLRGDRCWLKFSGEQLSLFDRSRGDVASENPTGASNSL